MISVVSASLLQEASFYCTTLLNVYYEIYQRSLSLVSPQIGESFPLKSQRRTSFRSCDRKITTSFSNHQIFGEVFFRESFKPSSSTCRLTTSVALNAYKTARFEVASAKVRQFFQTTKFLEKFFSRRVQVTLNLHPSFFLPHNPGRLIALRPPFRSCDCKSTAFLFLHKRLRTLFISHNRQLTYYQQNISRIFFHPMMKKGLYT